MAIVGKRRNAYEQRFGYRLDIAISVHRDALFGRRASGLLGYSSEMSASASPPRWNCPAHPRIVRGRPGTCPICGMTLVPIEFGYRACDVRAATFHPRGYRATHSASTELAAEDVGPKALNADRA